MTTYDTVANGYLVPVYATYLVATVAICTWLAITLYRNGAVFLADVFPDQPEMAQAVNRLLVVGFYLLNLGFVMLFLRVTSPVGDLRDMFETLSVKIGVVMLTLGALHFFNVYVFNAIRRRSRLERTRIAPLPPQGFLPPQPPAYPA